MANAVAKIGVRLTMDTGTVTLFEGDIVSDLVYMKSGVKKVINGSVRVINASTSSNNTSIESCPPEPYVHRYISPVSIVIDSSEQYEAEMVTVNILDIISIGTINNE